MQVEEQHVYLRIITSSRLKGRQNIYRTLAVNFKKLTNPLRINYRSMTPPQIQFNDSIQFLTLRLSNPRIAPRIIPPIQFLCAINSSPTFRPLSKLMTRLIAIPRDFPIEPNATPKAESRGRSRTNET